MCYVAGIHITGNGASDHIRQKKERRARGREGEQDGAVGGRKRSSRGRAAEDAPT